MVRTLRKHQRLCLKALWQCAKQLYQSSSQLVAANGAGSHIFAGNGIVRILIVIHGEHRYQNIQGIGRCGRRPPRARGVYRRVYASLADRDLQFVGVGIRLLFVEIQIVSGLFDAIVIFLITESQQLSGAETLRLVPMIFVGQRFSGKTGKWNTKHGSACNGAPN